MVGGLAMPRSARWCQSQSQVYVLSNSMLLGVTNTCLKQFIDGCLLIRSDLEWPTHVRVSNACLLPTISLTRFLINQLGCSVWNHLVSQKTWQNDSDLVLSDQHVLRVTNACVVRAKQHTTRANATAKHLCSRHQNLSARAKTRINYSSKRKHN